MIGTAGLQLIFFIVMTLSGALGGYCFKKVADYNMGFNKGFLIYFSLGGSLYFIGAIFNIILLRFLSYTTLYPLSSVTYIWTMILSYFLLSEKITKRKLVGIALIITGSLVLIK